LVDFGTCYQALNSSETLQTILLHILKDHLSITHTSGTQESLDDFTSIA